MPEWNENYRGEKFFDPKLDKNFKLKDEGSSAKKLRPSSAIQGAPSVIKNYEQGKVDVAFMKSNGMPGAKVEIYTDIDTLAQDT